MPLHAPQFNGAERQNLLSCIETTMVSSIGPFVDAFEEQIAHYSGRRYGVAVANGTVALQVALRAAGVRSGDEVITQPLSFIATANAIEHCGASPIFIDVSRETLGMDPGHLAAFLRDHTIATKEGCVHRRSGRRISACVPVHVFGHPCAIQAISQVCDEFKIVLVEDAAEAIGSFYRGRSCGSFGKLGVFSFNGNKIITAGGGGAIVTDDPQLAKWIKHVTTTAKIPHAWEYNHDEIGFNYRMPNLNAALVCAQMDMLSEIIASKRQLASEYKAFFDEEGIRTIGEPDEAKANYWLNCIELKDRPERDRFLMQAHLHGVLCRPVWRLLSSLPMYSSCPSGPLINAMWLEDRLVAIPSSARIPLRQ